ncbi:unnamed protein product [Leptosia nina]|uniref:Proteasome assembly chaperone 3 n=1 Tax=Leptosia nina TaxID=320188 RepID=A0AAV1JWK2_9NEOP
MELLDVMKSLSIKTVPLAKDQTFFKSVAVDIDEVPTEIVYGGFSDKDMLIVSQYHKMGSLFMITKDQVQNPLCTNDIYTTKVIFGTSGEEQQVTARHLAELIQGDKPVCIFLSLKSYDIETVKACKDIILELKKDIK